MSDPSPELLLRHASFVRALARSLVRDAHQAADVEQETWLRWLRRPPERLESAAGWLAHAVRSASANARRAQGRRSVHEARAPEAPARPTPDEEALQAELLTRVAVAVNELGEPERSTLLARYYRGLSARELAVESAVELATVRSRERRALEKLRARLERECGPGWGLLLARAAGVGPTAPAALAALVVAALLLVAGSAGLWWRNGAREERAPTSAVADVALAPEVVPVLAAEGGRTDERGALALPATEIDPMEADGSALVGRTVDPLGRPLAGVRLSFAGPAREARSDEAGCFRVEGLAHVTQVTAELAGYRTLFTTDPEPNGIGPFVPMVVTMAPTGALALTVLDDDGAPLEGVDVRVSPAWEETRDTSGLGGTPQETTIDAYTDSGGRVVLDGVWTGMKLELDLELGQGSPAPQALGVCRAGGELVLDDERGEPIVLRPDEPLELIARWGRAFRLRGRVHEGERPAGRCRLEVTDLGYPEDDPRATLTWDACDDAGVFDLELHPSALRGPLLVEANRSGPGPTGVLSSPDGVHTTHMASGVVRAQRKVALDELGQELVIALEPAPGALFTARLLAPDGTAVPGELCRWMTFGRDGAPTRSGSVSVPGGVFGFFLPEPGLYDLALTCDPALCRRFDPPLAPFALFEAWSSGSEAELRLLADAPVHLRVAEGPATGRLRLARFTPSDARARTMAPRQLVVDDPLWWPDESAPPRGSWQFSERELVADGVASFALGPPGWYAIGFSGASGPRVASELLYLEPGEYALVLRPPPTGSVQGRIEPMGTREFLGLSLLDARGQPVPLDADRGSRAEVQPVKASGEFLLRDLAVGRYRLRIGGMDELAAGHARRELELVVGPGTNPALEIRL